MSSQQRVDHQHLIGDSSALESLNHHETRLSAELRRTLKLLDAPLKNPKLHDEPNRAKPLHYDEDRDAAEAPISAIVSSTIHQLGAGGRPNGRRKLPEPVNRARVFASSENQKLHDEPNDAQPPHSDDDSDAPEGPPSTIHHPPLGRNSPAGKSRPRVCLRLTKIEPRGARPIWP